MQLRHKSLFFAIAATLALAAPAAGAVRGGEAGAAPAVGPWQQVGDDSKTGVSGVALTGRPGADGTLDALIVRDNKKPGENRLGHLTFRPDEPGSATVTPVTWEGVEPVDLEAVEAVPGAPGEYVAVASRGLVYRVVLDGGTAKVLDLSPLPAINDGADFESFALTSQHGKLVAVWADRGAGAERPATVFAAPFSFNSYGEARFGAVRKASFRAMYPKGDVRHISDISVTNSGRLVVSSAADAGDDGPFDSAVSVVGGVSVDASGAKVRLRLDRAPVVLGKFNGHKIEGVECLPGSREAVLGTDDEHKGGFVRVAAVCGD